LDAFNAAAVSADDAHRHLLDPFIAAACAALGEMAAADVTVKSSHRAASFRTLGDVSAVLTLSGAMDGFLVLDYPMATAAAFAGRILAGATEKLDDVLIRDCMGEIANVVAGQAKATLADPAGPLVFSVPRVTAAGDDCFRPPPELECLVVDLQTGQGDFFVQLVLRSKQSQ
jgi:chemotaxis protein CheX